MRLVDRAPVRSDFSTRLLRERDLQAKARSLARPVFTGPNSLAHVPLKGRQAGLPKGRWLCDESQTPGGARPSLEVHVSVTVCLGPGGPMVSGKDWAKSLSLPLSLSLSLSPFFTVCLGLQVLRVSVAIFWSCPNFVGHTHDCSTHVWCGWSCCGVVDFFDVVDFVEVPCCVGDV